MHGHRAFSLLVRFATVAAALSLLPIGPGAVQAAEQGPFAGLAGSWSGAGIVQMEDGSTQPIRCRAVYSVAPMGASLNQGLRCASDSYTFDVKSSVFVSEDGTLSGTWSEATRQVQGDVSGRVTPGHVQTRVECLGFAANLSIETKGARQAVSIRPDGTEVRTVTIEMRRI